MGELGSVSGANTPATSSHSSHTRHQHTTAPKMPSTPQMRKANEKNAKNVTKRGQVKGTSKDNDKYPVSPELIALCLRSHRLCRLPNHSVCVDGRTIGGKRPLLQLSSGAWEWISRERVNNPKIPTLHLYLEQLCSRGDPPLCAKP